MTVGLVYDEAYLQHEHTPTHPERKERLQYTMDQLYEEGLLDDPAVRVLHPDEATDTQLSRVHTDDYLERLRSMSASGSGKLSRDTHISANTWNTAKLAAGGVVTAMDAVVTGETDSAFVMARPGGHHASADDGHGFCYLNNTAVGIRHLQSKYDVENVLLWDWDAHHGDGTESLFYDDPSVLVMSTHQDGRTLFPGTGDIDDVGEAAGEGYNVNVPLPPKTSDEGYLRVVEEIFEPIAEQYDPDFVFIEAGQDNHFTDPITDLGVTAQGYTRLMEHAKDAANELAGGDLVASLAGGYGIEGGLPYTNLGVIATMAGYDTSGIHEPDVYEPPTFNPNIQDVLERVKRVQSAYWSL
ncbi:histone deacetylase family protein [Halanaeroarchaeum sulfurireducens]|uniref:Histone deacetylase family protein n=1 Tax=Halanaeroarchaeum sulfurireducens TaxID=1604004 RepID=A0A0F7PC69_9EURY|nr:histone deacetylase [Halanaeroarchaeum sulfurireducens]AKH97780.1 histone deacetylase family protein [Halanaeroarchaeum sulfurireducens]ALG82175.1 histone deacetylase family protein [Halanaeroarchaeum sulfurireducens]